MTRIFKVTKKIEGAHRLHTDYPLLKDDVLVEQDDGTFFKTLQGLGIYGFMLNVEKEIERGSIEQIESVPRFEIVGMDEYFGLSSKT